MLYHTIVLLESQLLPYIQLHNRLGSGQGWSYIYSIFILYLEHAVSHSSPPREPAIALQPTTHPAWVWPGVIRWEISCSICWTTKKRLWKNNTRWRKVLVVWRLCWHSQDYKKKKIRCRVRLIIRLTQISTESLFKYGEGVTIISQIIRWRIAATLRRPQTKQVTTSYYRGGVKKNGTSNNFDKEWTQGAPHSHFGKLFVIRNANYFVKCQDSMYFGWHVCWQSYAYIVINLYGQNKVIPKR